MRSIKGKIFCMQVGVELNFSTIVLIDGSQDRA
jgi:hypothetical protein